MKVAETKTAASSAKSNAPFFQKGVRQGLSYSADNEQPFFQKKVNDFPGIQAKLNIGKPNDKYEVEADAVADKVVQRWSNKNNINQNNNGENIQAKPIAYNTSISSFIQTKCDTCEQEEKLQKKEGDEDLMKGTLQKKPIFESNSEPSSDDEKNVQRKCATCKYEEKKVQTKSENDSATASPSIESSLSASKGSGSPLTTSVKNEMESSFGTDFSNVGIHNNSTAVQMSKDLNAQAFTQGNDIYFNEGKYDTASTSGKHLLAHELTHTVQQGVVNKAVKNTNSKVVQRGILGDAWDAVTGTVNDIGEGISSGISSIGNSLNSAWDTATGYLGDAASWAWEGLKTLSSDVLDWLSTAGSAVWDAIKWLGNLAWEGIKILGTFLWKKLVVIGTNLWSFIKNIPIRLWRLIVQLWDGITGLLGWAWNGISSAGVHVWDAVTGVFEWIGDGIEGALSWLGDGLLNGFNWAVDFVSDPTLDKLWNALTGSISWAWAGVKGFAKWGWDGVVGAAVWVWEGAKGFGKWIWDGLIHFAEWLGRMILYVLDFVGLLELLEITWGLIFRMRKLTDDERNASLEVHPSGMLPYELVWIDENSVLTWVNGGRAITTAHVLHFKKGGEPLHTVVHELSHVAQYQKTGSAYMAEAIHAQAFGAGYNYGNLTTQRTEGKHFKDFNREQQAQICEDYYLTLHGGGPTLVTDLQPFIDEMRTGDL